jgi:hypothetical protein
MKTTRCGQLGILLLTALCAAAQPAAPVSPAVSSGLVAPSVGGKAVVITNFSLLLSNSAVQVISQTRGIKAELVKLKFSDAMSGRFEVDPGGASDLRREAEALSTAFGTNFAVIVDEATADGRMRTNHVFRAGAARRTIAPVVNNTLAPGGRRLYVWPETSRMAAPSNVRLVHQ